MADELAKALGVDVWVPDMFAGKPIMKAEDMYVAHFRPLLMLNRS